MGLKGERANHSTTIILFWLLEKETKFRISLSGLASPVGVRNFLAYSFFSAKKVELLIVGGYLFWTHRTLRNWCFSLPLITKITYSSVSLLLQRKEDIRIARSTSGKAPNLPLTVNKKKFPTLNLTSMWNSWRRHQKGVLSSRCS